MPIDSARYLHSVYIDTDYANGDCLAYDEASGTFTWWAPDHDDLANIGTTSHATLDSHVSDATLHFTEASIDHTAIANIGTTSHADIDTAVTNSANHIAGGNPHADSAPNDHAATHIDGGAYAIDGDKIEISWTGYTAYTPDFSGGEVTAADQLTAHLVGIDTAIAGYVGGGEANTMSNAGSEVALFDTKAGVDFPLRSLSSDLYEEDSSIIYPKVAIPSVDSYCPLPIQWVDNANIKVLAGLYWLQGYRLYDQYVTQYCRPVTVASPISVDVDGASLLGGDVASSFYGVYLLDGTTVQILPFIRVDAIEYNGAHALKTTINPAAHDDGTTAANGFVSANDVFNTYRLVLLNKGTYHGNVYTIEDCVDGTPDEIIIDDDVHAEIAATEWLQMIPPSGTDCLFLGTIRFDSGGDLKEFYKTGHMFTVVPYAQINGVLGGTPGLTDLGAGIPPTASLMYCKPYIQSTTTSIGAQMYTGSSGTNLIRQVGVYANDSIDRNLHLSIDCPITVPGKILNNFYKLGGGSPDVGHFVIFGWKE
jgi:hypothetical protein